MGRAKKRSQSVVLTLVKAFVMEHEWFTKEGVSAQLKLRESQVEVALRTLNRMGVVEQPTHKAPHDSNREFGPGGCGFSGWQGDIYRTVRET